MEMIMNRMILKMRGVRSNPDARQFFKYIVVGFINTGVYYGIYYAILQFGFSYFIAFTTGTVVGVINSYFWNKYYTFHAEKKSIAEIAKFLIVYGIQYLSNLFIIYLCVNYAGISEEVAGLVAISVGLFIGYFGHKHWSFQH